jgi:polyisoprenoid-binding protein YceI
MKIARTAGIAITTALFALSLQVLAQDAHAPAAAHKTPDSAGDNTYKVDPVHSSNMFKVRHAGVANFYGRFNQMKGTVVWNEKDPSASSMTVEVSVESVDTNNAGRDKHLKSGDFFDAEKFPTMSFKSTTIKKSGEHTFDVTGDLTLHGVTKPITVKFEHGGTADLMGHRTGLETTFTIKRSDYEIGKNVPNDMLGNEVTMTVSLECVIPQAEGH